MSAKLVKPRPGVKPELTAEESTAARKAYYAAADASESDASTLQAACAYLDLFPEQYLFSVARGAKSPPCFPGYAMKASNDPKVLARMHDRWPGCSWGIAPAKSDIVVLDADLKPGKFGQRSLDALELAYGPLPKTSVVNTPSGGKHFRFKATNRVRHILKQNGFGQHLDSPPYTIIPGVLTYRLVDDTPLAWAPDWFADVLGEDRKRVAGGKLAPVCELDTDSNIAAATELLQYWARVHPAIQGEGGDAWTYQIALQVGDLGISEPVNLDLMFEFFNPFCVPQWNADHEESSSADRLSTKVRSAYTSRENPIGYRTAEAEFANDPAPALTPADVEAAKRVQDEREQARILAAELAQEESDV
jgi:hypothetical protein